MLLAGQSLAVRLSNFSTGYHPEAAYYRTNDQPAMVIAPRFKSSSNRITEKLLLITPRLRTAFQDQMSYPLRGSGTMDSTHYWSALTNGSRLMGLDSAGYLCELKNFAFPVRLSKNKLTQYFHRRPLPLYAHPTSQEIYTALRKNYSSSGGSHSMSFFNEQDSTLKQRFTAFSILVQNAQHYDLSNGLIPVVANSKRSDSLAIGYFSGSGQFYELFKQQFSPGSNFVAPLPNAIVIRKQQVWLAIGLTVYFVHRTSGRIDSTLNLSLPSSLQQGDIQLRLQFLGDTIASIGTIKTDTQSYWNEQQAFFTMYTKQGSLIRDSIFDYFPNSNTDLQRIIPAANGKFYLTGYSNERFKGNHFFIFKWPGKRVSLSENAAGGALLKLYPNPTSSNVQVTLSQPATLQLLTQQGEIVETQTRSAGTHEWVMNHLPKGLYLLKATTEGGGSQIKKLVLN